MRITELYIENFGKLSGFSLKLGEGLNTVNRENGYGKTTLTVFIKAMLYGLESGKKQSIFENDRKHYLPWGKGRCGGSLTFLSDKGEFRIERTFMPKAAEDTFKLYDVRTGKESDAYSERVGEELFALDEEGFLRTVFLSEENLTGKNENKSVATKLTNLVGCDGDISSLGEALQRLEAERKIYYKKSGSGEIGELIAKSAALERQISDLTRLGEEYKENETELARLTQELKAQESQRQKIRERAEELGKKRLRRSYVKQYIIMTEAQNEEKQRLFALDAFFKNDPPTLLMIDEIRTKMNEAEALRMQWRSRAEEKEAYEFGAGVSGEEYERAKECVSLVRKADGESAIIRNELDSITFSDTLPSKEEIDEAIDKANSVKKSDTGATIPHICAAFFALLGIALGIFVNPLCYILSAIGAILFFIGSASSKKKKKEADSGYAVARDLIGRYTGAEKSGDELLNALYELRMRSAEEQKKKERKEALLTKVGELELTRASLMGEINSFTSKFDGISATEPTARVAEIIEKRSIKIALIEERTARESAMAAAERRACELMREADEFISRFDTASPRPLDEIAKRLSEREAIIRSLERNEETLREWREKYSVTDEDILSFGAEEESEDTSCTDIDGEIARLEGMRAVRARRSSELLSELSVMDELIAERDATLAKKAEYEKKLEIIKKTKEYLSEAKDNLTAKYLAKTKEAFNKYITLIGRESSDAFNMTTSFEILKNEGGEYKDAEAYSRGTRDLYALALRLALIDSLYEGEKPFVILDDPFAYFDDTRLKGAKAAIKALAKEKQILYMTCTDSRNI